MPRKKVVFEVLGPYDVPVNEEAQLVTEQEANEFFRGRSHLRDRRGAYVFGIRTGGGTTPVYVGEAKKGFGQECFAPHKLMRYAIGLAAFDRGTPVMFFVAYPQNKGRVNVKVINDLEDFLIQNAKAKNPELVNKRGTKEADWVIRGVIRSGQGKPSDAARAFRTMMGLGT